MTTQPNTKSLETKTVTELYEEYGLNEARRIIVEAKIERIRKALIRGETVEEQHLAKLCIEAEQLFVARFRISGEIRKKEGLRDYE